MNDMAVADDIALLLNPTNLTRVLWQLDALKLESGKVGLEINVQKIEQTWLNTVQTEIYLYKTACSRLVEGLSQACSRLVKG